jgi:hypothetical protein
MIHLPYSRTTRFLYEAASTIGWNRREFLRSAAGLAISTASIGLAPYRLLAANTRRKKVVVVTFGGGARDEETFTPEGQENIPNLLRSLGQLDPLLL